MTNRDLDARISRAMNKLVPIPLTRSLPPFPMTNKR